MIIVKRRVFLVVSKKKNRGGHKQSISDFSCVLATGRLFLDSGLTVHKQTPIRPLLHTPFRQPLL